MKLVAIPNNLKEDLTELQDMESILTNAADYVYHPGYPYQEQHKLIFSLRSLIVQHQREIRASIWKALPGIPKGEEFLQFRAKTSQYAREFRELGDKLKIV
jgi:hypothetical protein